MIDHVDTEITDMGTYLGRIGSRLDKEGNALQALARMWGDDNQNIVRTFGADIIDLGEQLLAMKNRRRKPAQPQQNYAYSVLRFQQRQERSCVPRLRNALI